MAIGAVALLDELPDVPQRQCIDCLDWWPDDAEFFRDGRAACRPCDLDPRRERRRLSSARRAATVRLAAAIEQAYGMPVEIVATPAIAHELEDYSRSPGPARGPLGYLGEWIPEPRRPYRMLSWARIGAAFGVSSRVVRSRGLHPR